MSFVEKHKAWLLPALALGIGGVVYLNIKTFSGGSSAPATVATSPQTAPAPTREAPPPPAPESVQASPTPSAANASGQDLWSDLRPFAQVPASLAQEQNLEALARNAVSLEYPAGPSAVMRPSHIQDPKPEPKPDEQKAALEALTVVPPQLEFLIHRDSGSNAWFDGRPYEKGQRVDGKPFVLHAIDPTSVVLQGPLGPTQQWTNPVHSSKSKVQTSEVP